MSRYAYCDEFAFNPFRSVSISRTIILFLLVTEVDGRTLWAFDVRPPLDEFGKPVLPDKDSMDGYLSIQPHQLSYHLVPREANVPTVVRAEAVRAEEELVSWM